MGSNLSGNPQKRGSECSALPTPQNDSECPDLPPPYPQGEDSITPARQICDNLPTKSTMTAGMATVKCDMAATSPKQPMETESFEVLVATLRPNVQILNSEKKIGGIAHYLLHPVFRNFYCSSTPDVFALRDLSKNEQQLLRLFDKFYRIEDLLSPGIKIGFGLIHLDLDPFYARRSEPRNIFLMNTLPAGTYRERWASRILTYSETKLLKEYRAITLTQLENLWNEQQAKATVKK
jgi:hypothetical protein